MLLLLLASCTTKRLDLPDYSGADIRTIIADRSSIEEVAATFSIEFEKNDSSMSGEAALELSEDHLDLRVYSLGFLIAEVTEKDGIIKSIPEFSASRKALLVDGLKNSFLWWMIKNYEVSEENGYYLLKNPMRKITIDRKTMIPVLQTIETENGREIKILYEDPLESNGILYPSRMRIELSRNVLKVKIKTIGFLRNQDRDQQQQRL